LNSRLALHEVLEGNDAVGHKIIWRQSGIMKDGQVNVANIGHIVDELLVPNRIECLWPCGGSIWRFKLFIIIM